MTAQYTWSRDRISAIGPQIDRLVREHLDRLPFHRSWQSRASELLRAGVMDTRLNEEEFVLYTDEVVVITGNTQASAGYLYVCAYLRTVLDGEGTP